MSRDNVIRPSALLKEWAGSAPDSVTVAQEAHAEWDTLAAEAKRKWDEAIAKGAARKGFTPPRTIGQALREALATIDTPDRPADRRSTTVKITKHTIDRGLTVAAAAAAPVLAILIRHHVISTADATDIGVGVTAVVASYHGGAAVQRKRSVPTVADVHLP